MLGSSAFRHRVLIVDDEAEVLRVLKRVLGKEMEVVCAGNAEAALALLGQSRDFDVVISDYEMVDRDGIWLLAQVSRLQPQARRVLMSGRPPATILGHCAASVVECFLPKPFPVKALRETIRDLLAAP